MTLDKTGQDNPTGQIFENEFLIIRDSGIHNLGAFAKVKIAKGTKIIEYIGEKISKDEGTRREDESIRKHKEDPESYGATYIFELDDEYDIDGDVDYNPAKYLNHSCEPNCEIEIMEGHIWILASRDINIGEETTFNYGFEIRDDDLHLFMNYPCLCGKKNCVGYMLAEEEWPRMREILLKHHMTVHKPE
jgi:uncharacterized protein